MYSLYSSATMSKRFEDDILEAVSSFARRMWGPAAVKLSTERQDKHEGTDISVLGVPIDVTLNYGMKDKMRQVDEIRLDWLTVRLGIRFGNKYADFRTPVLVIGVESLAEIYMGNLWLAIDALKERIGDILEAGFDRYFVATEAAA